jgi:hypothetical protein
MLRKLSMMKISIFILISFLVVNTCLSQDMIFFKDGSTKVVKIKNVGEDTIKYKIYEVVNSPLYKVQKSDILSIFYKEGYREFFTQKIDSAKTVKYNPSNSSIIYILYDYKMDEGNYFPLYFNGKYVCTLKNHSRLKYTMRSAGRLQVERKGIHTYMEGPLIYLSVEPGKLYGINILPMYPQALDPNKKFKYDVIIDSIELNQFIKTKFYGFKPFKADDYIFEEDKDNPLFD